MNENKRWLKYEPRKDNLLFMLHEVQDQYREEQYVPRKVIAEIAEYLGMPVSEVDGIASFYTLFSVEPRGRYILRLCDSLSCRILGSLDIYHYIKDRLGIKNGETTPDGLFTLEVVNCLGSCDTAPNMLINDTLYTNLSTDKLDELFDKLREEVKV